MSFCDELMSRTRANLQAPTLVALLFCATAVNYLDRQALSIVAPLLRVQLGLTPLHYSRIIFLFLLGYMFGQTLAGKLIDRIGGAAGPDALRGVLVRRDHGAQLRGGRGELGRAPFSTGAGGKCKLAGGSEGGKRECTLGEAGFCHRCV